MLANTRVNDLGGGAPCEGITLAGKLEGRWGESTFWEAEKEGCDKQADSATGNPLWAVVEEDIKVQASHAGFHGRWSERRVAAINGGEREKKQKIEEPDHFFVAPSVPPSGLLVTGKSHHVPEKAEQTPTDKA